MIALIDYGSGNIRSVSKALQHEGADVQLVDSPEGLSNAEAVVLPGVGAFGDCVRNLKSRNLWDSMRGWLDAGKPFLGICVGYQLLLVESEEDSVEKGFGFFHGKVKRFSAPGIKVPQIGWNAVNQKKPDCPMFAGVDDGAYFYFVHSFYVAPEDPSIVVGETGYGLNYCSAVWKDNVFAVQFHPEKSQAAGLQMLKNFGAQP